MSLSKIKIKANSSEKLILAGDIGGTKTSLAFFIADKSSLVLKKTQTFPTASADTPVELIQQFLNQHKNPPVSQVCLGIAGPVFNGTATTTNLPWTISEQELKIRFNWNQVSLINDLVALAYAVPHLNGDQLLPINNLPHPNHGNIGVIAAGTGLGEALLIWDEGRYHPCASEGGHKDFAPRNEQEYRLHRYLTKAFGHASMERVVSGQGLVNIYNFLKEDLSYQEPRWLAERLSAEDAAAVISQSALNKQDPTCIKALELFIQLYGSEAGDIALQAMTFGGIYIGGGIGPKIAPALKNGGFMQGFLAKGRMRELLEKIPISLIHDSQAALKGAAAYAQHRP
ncbi:MAG: glucokinase [Desulfobulbaceae bacterium]|nr:glucokinase [Desulfobulbaceae bacterium]HIJ79085.1 glucokinase [Deltaproteobacteria bacterium]